jgi:hypothetical protein
MTGLAVRNDAAEVAGRLFGNRVAERDRFIQHLLESYEKAEGNDFLVIHNPGGWGSSRLERCLDWERSIVEGVKTTIDRMGYSSALTQYFRTRDSLLAHFLDTKEQASIFLRGRYSHARFLAAEIKFITTHVNQIRIVMVGVSQGAGFSNAVMRQLDQGDRTYSIELGMMFIQVPRRVCTDHTLAVDGNGLVPDPIVHRDLWAGTRAYALAPFRWLKYQMIGQPRRFTRCVVMPGHDYSWEYPGVRKKIEDFLRSRFGKDQQETHI